MTPTTLNELLTFAAQKWQDHPYLISRTGNSVSTRTYSEVLTEVESVAGGLIDSGVKPGDHIALLSENRLEWVIAYYAILATGAVVVPVDSLMSPLEIATIIQESGARMVIVSRRFLANLAVQHSSLDGIERTFILDDYASGDVDALPRKAGVPLPTAKPEDIAAIIFTSGTTGHSKGVVLTHRNLCSNVISIVRSIDIQPTDNFLMLLPLHHTFSCTISMLCPPAFGASATLASSFKSRDIIDDIRICGVTLLIGVPQLYENLMTGMLRAVADAGKKKQILFNVIYGITAVYGKLGIPIGKVLFKSMREKAGLSSIRLLVSGGAALRIEVNRFFYRLGFCLIQGYGLTETSPVLSANLPHHNRLGAVGPAIQDVEIRIENPDKYGIGEICARGPNIMQGYFKNPEATAKVIKDGWFHTGDAGFLDSHKYLHITGRIKNVIVTGAGKNVYPEEIESRFNASPLILESVVLGVERKRGTGEELCAIFVLDNAYIEAEKASGNDMNIQDEIKKVVDDYNGSVPHYRQIRQWKLREEEFEKTSTRKIKRYLYKSLSFFGAVK